MNEIVDKYDTECNKQLFELEVARPIKEYKHYGLIMNIIPLLYNIFLAMLLVIYLVEYGNAELRYYRNTFISYNFSLKKKNSKFSISNKCVPVL